MIAPIFRDELTQKLFDQDGFVKIKLLEEEDVDRAKQLFHQYFPEGVDNFFSSLFIDNYKIKKEISQKLAEIAYPRIERVFKNHRNIGCLFSVKGTGEKSGMRLHQDWSIVDENKYVSVNVWIALLKTTEENGTIELLKGSHLWKRTLRAPTIPFYFGEFEKEIRTKLTIINTNPGEAVVINHATLHYSKPNMSETMRLTMAVGLASSDAVVRLPYYDSAVPDKIQLFEQEDDFFLKFTDFHESIYHKPKAIKDAVTEDFQLQPISRAEVEQFLSAINNSETLNEEKHFKKLD